MKLPRAASACLWSENPANTNAWIAMNSAPDLPKANFTAMLRLDHNRARSMLAAKVGKPVDSVENLTVWGNHSPTMYPDIRFATVDGTPATKLVDQNWYKNEYLPKVGKRGSGDHRSPRHVLRRFSRQRSDQPHARLGAGDKR